MKTFRITRQNPRTGRTERPWRNRDGVFVLGDPAHGAQKHHDKFAVKVSTLEEVAAHVARGFSVRMTDGESPPSLISPDSLIVEEIDTEETEAGSTATLWAETLPQPPFSKEAMFDELKRILLVHANQIANIGRLDAAIAFMGYSPVDEANPYCDDPIDKVDLRRFNAPDIMDIAYDFAFQIGRYYREFSGHEYDHCMELVEGASRLDSNAMPSPITNPNGLVRRTAEMASARWALGMRFDLTVRQLALLAGDMTDAAVRNSLSKEKIATVKGAVDSDVALLWLKQRRGFIQTRVEEGRAEGWADWARSHLDKGTLNAALPLIIAEREITASSLAEQARVSNEFVTALICGRPHLDVEALQRVGGVLGLDVPHFVGIAVQAALRAGGTA
jgi:hypothetical protein